LIRYLEFLVSSFQALHSALHSNAPEKWIPNHLSCAQII
jgi:hypothetical protein